MRIVRLQDGTHEFLGELPPPQRAMKKPIPITVYRMDESFSVETLEGTMEGKKDDWLMVGIRGEMYPCDADIFAGSYDIVDEG